jgi:signal transduction histidine kinase
MENQHLIIQQLKKEIEYYKKQLNLLSGSAISRDYRIAEMNNMTKQMRTGFALIADLNQFKSAYHFEEIYDHFTEQINIQLQNDVTLILQPCADSQGYFIPTYIKGNIGTDNIDIKEKIIFFDPIFLRQKTSLLVNSQSNKTKFIEFIIDTFGIPFFIITPIIVAEKIIAYIFTGRKKETLLFASSRLMIQDAHALEAIAGVIAAIKNQHEQFNQLAKERARISSDLHDEIGSGLTQIALLCDLLQQDIIPDKKLFNKIPNIARELINNLNELVWSTNPGNDSFDILCSYLRNYIYDYLTQSGIQFNINFPDEIPTKAISAEIRRHLVMLVKEALNNIVKHSKATHVMIQLVFEMDYFNLEITDNGIGINPDYQLKKRNGIQNMEKRVNEIQGQFLIQTKTNIGTSLTFIKIPYLTNTKM